MKKILTTALFALGMASATQAADLYLDLNGTTAGFGVDSTVSPITVDPTAATWNTDSTGGAGGTITTVTDGDALNFGLEGTAGILFNWVNYTNVTLGGIHTYQTLGSTASINRFQKQGGGFTRLLWAPGATFDTEQACSLWWDLGTTNDFEKIGTQWLIFADGGPKVNGTVTISEGNIIVRNLGTVSTDSNFKLNGGEFRFDDNLDDVGAVTANIGVLSGSGTVTRDGSANDLQDLTVQMTGVDMVNNSAIDLINLVWGIGATLRTTAATTMEINKSGGTTTNDMLIVDWGGETLTLGGDLAIDLLAGSDALADGDTFDLFSDNLAGWFDSFTLPALGPGLTWDITSLTTDGTLSVATGSTNPVAIPTGLTATGGVYTVTLDWNDNGEANLGGYKVYRSTTSGSGYAAIGITTDSAFVDTTTTPNDTTYYYVVTAHNLQGTESTMGTESSAHLAFGLGNGDFEAPVGGGSIDASGHWVQNGSDQAIQAAVWAAESESNGAWLKAFTLSVTNSFYQDVEGTGGLDYTLDAGFKLEGDFILNGGQLEMALIWLDGANAEISRDTLDVDATYPGGAIWAHLDIAATAPLGTETVRTWFYWTTTINANDGGAKSAFVDNVSITRSGSQYAAWADSFGLVGGDAALDFDFELDGMDNLTEYALGGNPTIDDAAIVQPMIAVAEDGGTDWFYHIHNERTDDATLSFTVQLKGDLVTDPTWETNGVEFVDESGVVADFKSVTNRTDVGSTEEFLRLKIEQN